MTHFRVKYDNSPQLDIRITDIVMDTADVRNTGLGSATFVEECQCPTGNIPFLFTLLLTHTVYMRLRCNAMPSFYLRLSLRLHWFVLRALCTRLSKARDWTVARSVLQRRATMSARLLWWTFEEHPVPSMPVPAYQSIEPVRDEFTLRFVTGMWSASR